MAFYLGKTLELVGLALAALALYMGIAEESMSRELTWLLVGALCFVVGRLIETRDAGGGS